MLKKKLKNEDKC